MGNSGKAGDNDKLLAALYIHDLYIFGNFPPNLLNENTSMMINKLVKYILNPNFQALRDGYGYAWIKERRTCYGWGGMGLGENRRKATGIKVESTFRMLKVKAF